MKIFDTHTHDYFKDFDEDREHMLLQDFQNGVVGKIQIGCDIETSEKALRLSQTDEKMWCTIGIHPCHVSENYSTLKHIEKIFEEMIEKNPEKIVGIGETGFDFFHNDSPLLRSQQEESFLLHCKLAHKHKKTLVIHTRGARNETLKFLQKNMPAFPGMKAVIHCFSEDTDFAQEVTQQYGFSLGIGGVCTYKKNDAIRDAIAQVNMKYLVTETDSPYLAPQGKRGKRNQSTYIAEVIEKIAEVREMEVEQCSEVLHENAKALFSICLS